LWCKEADKRAVFADITRVGVAAKRPTQRQEEIFHIVHKAQKDATDFVVNRFKNKKRVEGWEVDDVARKVIQRAGYGDKFLHRTGHSIDMSLHGSGAHLDNIETHDVRPILPGTCFSVEPGIYLEGEFGVRLEYDLYVDLKGKVRIVGGVQNEIVCLLP
jgi:Xaa-Pro aminopeptidase